MSPDRVAFAVPSFNNKYWSCLLDNQYIRMSSSPQSQMAKEGDSERGCVLKRKLSDDSSTVEIKRGGGSGKTEEETTLLHEEEEEEEEKTIM